MTGFFHPKRLAVTAVLTLVLLEIVLQVGALVVWLTHSDGSDVAATDNIVLCAGDSFTYGMGAQTADGNYPAQLQARLREEFGPSWSVVNVGYPSLNSREILERTVRGLQEHKARFVCVLAGNNDVWSRPKPLTLPPPGSEIPETEGSDPGGFRFELRLLRFARWLSGRFAEGRAEDPTDLVADSSLAGTQWSGQGFWLAFGAEGELQFSGPSNADKLDGHWTQDGDTIELTGLGITCRHVDDILMLNAPGLPKAIRLTPHEAETPAPTQAAPKAAPPKPTVNSNKLVWDAIRKREFDAAEAIILPELAAELAETKPDPNAIARWRSALVRVYSGLGQREKAEAQCADLEALFESNPSGSLAGKVLSSLATTGNADRCLELGKSYIERFPDSQQVWSTYAWQLFQHSDDWDGAVAAAKRALDLLPKDRSKSLGSQYRTLVQMYLRRDPEQASRYAVMAFRADRDRMRFRQSTRWFNSTLEYEDFESLTTELLDEELREIAMAECAIGFGRAPKESVSTTFRAHMNQVVAHSKAAGAEVILVSYPTGRALTDPELEALAAEGTPTLMLPEVFRAQQHATPDTELFAPDGHCNDAGYALMANQVFELIKQQLEK